MLAGRPCFAQKCGMLPLSGDCCPQPSDIRCCPLLPVGTRRAASPRRRSASSTTPSATTSTADSWSATCGDQSSTLRCTCRAACLELLCTCGAAGGRSDRAAIGAAAVPAACALAACDAVSQGGGLETVVSFMDLPVSSSVMAPCCLSLPQRQWGRLAGALCLGSGRSGQCEVNVLSAQAIGPAAALEDSMQCSSLRQAPCSGRPTLSARRRTTARRRSQIIVMASSTLYLGLGQ